MRCRACSMASIGLLILKDRTPTEKFKPSRPDPGRTSSPARPRPKVGGIRDHSAKHYPATTLGFGDTRVGDHRIVCKIEDERLIVIVVIVGHRRLVYTANTCISARHRSPKKPSRTDGVEY